MIFFFFNISCSISVVNYKLKKIKLKPCITQSSITLGKF